MLLLPQKQLSTRATYPSDQLSKDSLRVLLEKVLLSLHSSIPAKALDHLLVQNLIACVAMLLQDLSQERVQLCPQGLIKH